MGMTGAGKRWTQSALARAAGLSREVVWSVLNEKADPKDETLQALAEAMGIPLPDIGGRGGENGGRSEEAALDEEQFREFLRNIERTARATIGNPSLWDAEETRINQRGLVASIMRNADKAGRPIPDWLPRIFNELVNGTFR